MQQFKWDQRRCVEHMHCAATSLLGSGLAFVVVQGSGGIEIAVLLVKFG